jgi:hypothetical protein
MCAFRISALACKAVLLVNSPVTCTALVGLISFQLMRMYCTERWKKSTLAQRYPRVLGKKPYNCFNGKLSEYQNLDSKAVIR